MPLVGRSVTLLATTLVAVFIATALARPLPSSMVQDVRVVLDTGAVPTSLPTGGVVWLEQTLAIRFTVPNTTIATSKGGEIDGLSAAAGLVQFDSFDFIIDPSRLVAGGNNLTITLCPEAHGQVPAETSLCLENATFTLPITSTRINGSYVSTHNSQLVAGSNYWLVVAGNAAKLDYSFSWLDSTNGTAWTAFRVKSKAWVSEDTTNGASTALVRVRM
ncbi:hypothetical protein CAOG_01175 [Capsaspora owczarzaki ATCC 30864]|uniref:Uncharacterized protein n=1 Tax=Capsaspora owczarzaki (strain ATCC 30864) TaxID=595528 RepID=A0A0D2U3G2_CAPO3|nr:hypothetical protein CAOG_01175 [Capsaspora owczarzaki ATCC 30864]KJE89746.1 hypothetical protein CAOG_001175 [Capsaspora owczarzaki ATCC 30864]|eukprot:XP_004366046.1 hypothetical protein CAOG_01175 [Capsaspora owczarzaki ATCC 30864]